GLREIAERVGRPRFRLPAIDLPATRVRPGHELPSGERDRDLLHRLPADAEHVVAAHGLEPHRDVRPVDDRHQAEPDEHETHEGDGRGQRSPQGRRSPTTATPRRRTSAGCTTTPTVKMAPAWRVVRTSGDRGRITSGTRAGRAPASAGSPATQATA